MNRFGSVLILVCVTALVLCSGCERLPPYTLDGGNVRGTWDFLRASLRPVGILPFPIVINRDEAEAQGMVGQITFNSDGTCEGEVNSPDGDDTFDGEWETDDEDIKIEAGTVEIEGKFGVTGDILTIETTQDVEGRQVAVVLQFEEA